MLQNDFQPKPKQTASRDYSISKNTPIVIYGGGRLCEPLIKRLTDAGYKVNAILDQNPDAIKGLLFPVMTPENYFSSMGDSFVFVALANGISHSKVAKKLIKIGFTKILFLSLYIHSSFSFIMTNAWNSFYAGNFDVSIPEYDSLWQVSSNDFIMHEDNSGYVVVIVHKDHILTSNTTDYNDPFSAYKIDPTQQPESLLDFNKHFTDPDFLRRFTETVKAFKTGAADTLDKFMFDPYRFFLICASPAKLDKTGFFNLFDGHHRTLYLINREFNGIPIRIKKEDWVKYFNENAAQNLMNYCRNLDSLPFQICHPAFVMFPVQEREAEIVFMELYNKLCIN